MVKEFLKEHNIEFKEVNVAEDAQARQEIMEKSGQSGVPVTEIGDKIIIGFDRDGLKRALNVS
jgi:glutaredoxin